MSTSVEVQDRGIIARYLLIGSAGGIVLVALCVLCGAAIVDKAEFKNASALVFNALLPLFGTWVGTVTAYYFSKENFRAANESVEKMVQLTTEQRLAKHKVSDRMIPRQQMKVISLQPGKDESSVTLGSIRALLDDSVTRVPILDHEGRTKFVIHQSVLFKFIVEQTVQGSTPMGKLTLRELANDEKIGALIRSLAFIPAAATVAEAKSAMERLAKCQDVIVTEHGRADEATAGWLTNVDIGKLATA